MNESVLTTERILDVAEDVLRRYGFAKATVVDVARVLGVSHGSVYRHFPSKAALRDAVTARWLDHVHTPLEAIVTEDATATKRLRHWFDQLLTKKHKRALEDPEMFATYHELAVEAREVTLAHVEVLIDQLRRIVADGVARGEFTADDPDRMARAIFTATVRFHDPAHAAYWRDPDSKSAFEGVWQLILAGLGVKAA